MKDYKLTPIQRKFLERAVNNEPWKSRYHLNIKGILKTGTYCGPDRHVLNNIARDYILEHKLKIIDYEFVDGKAIPIYGKTEVEIELPF